MKTLSKNLHSLVFYKFWLGASVVLLFLLGSLPLGIILKKEIALISQLKIHTKSLNSRYSYVTETYDAVISLPGALSLIDKNQYENFDLHHYMVPLFSACTRAGFEVESFQPVKDDGYSGYIVSLKVWGIGKVDKLVENIETLEIASKVESVSVSSSKGRSTVALRIYVLNPEETL